MKIIDYRTTKFVIVPRSLVEDTSLSHRDKCVYMALAMYASNSTKAGHPSVETIGRVVGCSRSTIFRALKKLEDGGYVKREERFNSIGKQLSSVYYLLEA